MESIRLFVAGYLAGILSILTVGFLMYKHEHRQIDNSKSKIDNSKSKIDNCNVPDDIVHTNRAGGPMR